MSIISQHMGEERVSDDVKIFQKGELGTDFRSKLIRFVDNSKALIIAHCWETEMEMQNKNRCLIDGKERRCSGHNVNL